MTNYAITKYESITALKTALEATATTVTADIIPVKEGQRQKFLMVVPDSIKVA